MLICNPLFCNQVQNFQLRKDTHTESCLAGHVANLVVLMSAKRRTLAPRNLNGRGFAKFEVSLPDMPSDTKASPNRYGLNTRNGIAPHRVLDMAKAEPRKEVFEVMSRFNFEIQIYRAAAPHAKKLAIALYSKRFKKIVRRQDVVIVDEN